MNVEFFPAAEQELLKAYGSGCILPALEPRIMKAYVITNGTIFGLIVVAHVLRLFAEGLAPAKEPAFLIFSIAAAFLLLWSVRVFRALPKT